MSPRAHKSKNIESKQQNNEQGQQNDRQFRCKCSKSYKSYPALYTHIKNKHSDKLQEYKSESKRPREYQIDKGRPKKHGARPMQADEQGELLNIIELGVLEIQNALKGHRYSSMTEGDMNKFEILVGNNRLQFQELRKYYDKEKTHMIERMQQIYGEEQCVHVVESINAVDLAQLRNELPVKIYKEDIKFKHELIQHFNAITAAKIIIHLQLLELESRINYPQNQHNNNDNDKEVSLKQQKLMERGHNENSFTHNNFKNIIKSCEQSLWDSNINIVTTVGGINKNWHQKLAKIVNHQAYSSEQDQSDNESEQSGEDQHSVHEINQKEKQQGQPDELMDCINTDYFNN